MKMKKKQRFSKGRLQNNRKWFGILALALTMLALLTFVYRFSVIMQGHVDGKNLTKSRLSQITNKSVLPATRGAIVDESGSTISASGKTYTLYAVLKPLYTGDTESLVKDRENTAKVLAKYLNLSESRILAALYPEGKNIRQIEFGTAGTDLSLDTKNRILAEKLKGIGFTESTTRMYPNGIFASHVVGRTAATTNKAGVTTVTGTMGLEKEFNNILTGKSGLEVSQRDVFGYKLPNTSIHKKKATDGGTVYTTINSNLQSYLETLMDTVQNKYEPTKLTATVMDANTGAIVATSQRPTFDPKTGTGLASMWRNALVEDAYEPGSIMKIMTLSAAIDSGNFNPNRYYKSGSISIGGGTVYDWQRAGWGTIPLSQAFPRSSNTGMVTIEQTMGAATWKKYLTKFGFGTTTGITLPGESKGSIDFSGTLSQASTAFGQAIDVTVVQMLRAMSAVANDGVMVQPRIVSKTVSGTGVVTKYGTKTLGRVIKKSTAETVRGYMSKVVNATYGTGQVYKIKGMNVGVKTGTAQIAGSGGYLTGANNYTFSVAGMVPISKPKYIVYITMKQPQKMTDDPEKIINKIFTPLVKRAVALEGTGATSDTTTTASVNGVTGQSLASAETALKDQGYDVSVVGTGSTVVQQLPTGGQKAIVGSRVILMTNGAMTMPSVVGWGKSDVLKLAQLTGVSFKMSGNGFATKQSLKEGALITGDGGTITFAGQ